MKKRFFVTSEPLSVKELAAEVTRPEAGAVVQFIGTVREFTKGRRTVYLEYEAYHSMAEKQLEAIGRDVKERWPDAESAVGHRTGELQISDAAVVIAVSTPHRKDAYEANEYIIERIKQIVPIWKKEHWEDGEQWVGDQLEQTRYPDGSPGGGNK